MATYAFANIVGTISGPGGVIPIGSGSGVGEGGITVTPTTDKNTMMIGADGSGMNSLMADSSGNVTVRMLKTSATNSALSLMYNYQTQSSLTHGQNTIQFMDIARGDSVTCTGVAFKKQVELTYGKEGGENEWTFDATSVTIILGVGTPEI